MSTDDDLPECCGSGCTNCVQDQKAKFRKYPSTRPSILDGGYKTFQCSAISQCSFNTFLFRFRYLPSASEITSTEHELRIPPGSHLMLRAPRNWRDAQRPLNAIFTAWRKQYAMCKEEPRVQNGVDRKTAVEKYDQNERNLYFSRPYTPIRTNPTTFEFEVLIRMEKNGEMSEYLQTLSIGDSTEWKGYYTGYVWQRNAKRNLICFAQGVGLAPIYSILEAILDDEEDETRLNLVYCCKDVDGILMRDKLLKMSAYWNFDVAIYLSREHCLCGGKNTRNCLCLSSKIKYGEKILNHRFEKIDLESLLFSYGQQDSLQVLICGTESFTKLLEDYLTALNIKDVYKF